MFEPLKTCTCALTLLLCAGSAQADCVRGIYRRGTNFFILGNPGQGTTAPAQRYAFFDGRRGSTGDAGALVHCEGDNAVVKQANDSWVAWQHEATKETATHFTSDGTKLWGELIEPAGAADPHRPLVVAVHGSEKTLVTSTGYMLVAQGISVFFYDKRGTLDSQGEYTQNFELLGDDAAAALREARRLAAGRFGRAGFFGGSQGGWVAPLAGTRAPTDFVAIGYGLVVSPIDEDLEQMLQEADEQRLGAGERAEIRQLSAATAAIVSSHFERGFEQLDAFRRRHNAEPWAQKIEGEYSGAMLRMSDADLRRIGRAEFDSVGLIWDYNAEAALARLKAPLLWVLAGDDREAPIDVTEQMLRKRRAAGQKIDVYVFPHTDHGIFEFKANADGSRTMTQIAPGYFKLLADWIKRAVHGSYGNSERL